LAFLEGCRKWGYRGEVVGTEGVDIGGTIALAEQVLAKGEAAGLVVWTGNPAFNAFIEKAARAKLPVIAPHFPVAEGSTPGLSGIISCDPAEYSAEAARAIGKAIGGKGAVAVTQGSFNTTENLAAETFTKAMKEAHPEVKVLAAEEEGFDPAKGIAKAVSIVQAHADLVGAYSTTGGGPTTWAGAQKETGRKLVAIGMDYTRVNLDLVSEGRVYAVVGQPLWEENFEAVGLIDKVRKGEKIPWWTKLPAPLITRDRLGPYREILDKVEAALKQR
jgi:ribose transport system substrate-binding protein